MYSILFDDTFHIYSIFLITRVDRHKIQYRLSVVYTFTRFCLITCLLTKLLKTHNKHQPTWNSVRARNAISALLARKQGKQ